MDKVEFRNFRKKIGKTQKQLSGLLGMSLKTIHSYEQGWRTIPSHIERKLYFLHVHKRGRKMNTTPCWEQKECSCKEQCPAWEFQSGNLCWYLCDTLCECSMNTAGKSKLDICKSCDILSSLIE
jgi:hypothetical protein